MSGRRLFVDAGVFISELIQRSGSVGKMMRRVIQVAAIGVMGLFAASGCLSGSYDEAFRGSMGRYRQEAEFQRLHREPKALAGNRLLLRVPKLFTEEDATGDKERSKPPFLKDFPGFAVAYQALLDADGAQLPAVLSVGAPIDKDSGLEDLKKRILNQVQKEASFAKAAWAAGEGQAAANGQASWSVLKLSGPQPFDRVNKGVTESKNSDGETQIWVASDADTKVSAVLVWRVPAELAATVPLDEFAGLVARTVEFKAPAEPGPADPAPAAAAPQAAAP